MSRSTDAPWDALFPSPARAEDAVAFQLRLLRRHGQPLLLLPARPAVVREALALYPAQTPQARLARWLAGVGLRTGLAPGIEQVTLSVDRRALFTRFLFPGGEVSPATSFALLCGNPHARGRRCILLVFDASGRPCRLVKAGVGPDAVELIRREAAFLRSVPAAVASAPALLGEFRGQDQAAMALEYAGGPNPDPRQAGPLARLLTGWLRPAERVALANLPAWQRLAKAASANPLFGRLNATVADARVAASLYHGDLAPWNIRVAPGTERWVVLDWERGEQSGPPGWDWFHFLVQTEILVRRARPAAVAERIEALLRSVEFDQYARAAGIEAIARPLVVAYLLYCVEVMPPAEGDAPTRALLELVGQQWTS